MDQARQFNASGKLYLYFKRHRVGGAVRDRRSEFADCTACNTACETAAWAKLGLLMKRFLCGVKPRERGGKYRGVARRTQA